ncbi:hypothetical protein V5F50_19900 [Xanthobacter sp. V13C-7B]|uniref:hypothetical protein n=1 Tax=Xanthobacter variabilis TaxID=3119932 RepID=UPI00372A3A3B
MNSTSYSSWPDYAAFIVDIIIAYFLGPFIMGRLVLNMIDTYGKSVVVVMLTIHAVGNLFNWCHNQYVDSRVKRERYNFGTTVIANIALAFEIFTFWYSHH